MGERAWSTKDDVRDVIFEVTFFSLVRRFLARSATVQGGLAKFPGSFSARKPKMSSGNYSFISNWVPTAPLPNPPKNNEPYLIALLAEYNACSVDQVIPG